MKRAAPNAPLWLSGEAPTRLRRTVAKLLGARGAQASGTVPSVSVIVPAYNAERWISKTLASVSAQRFQPAEIIVVDDGSTDRTPCIVEAAGETDPRIILLRQDRRGVAAARNRASASARGDIIAPIDADDLWHPEYLGLQVGALVAPGPQVTFSCAGSFLIDDEDRLIDRIRLPGYPCSGREATRIMMLSSISGGSATVFWRESLATIGGYDESLRARGVEGCEDLALLLSLAEQGDMNIAQAALVAVRRHESNMSLNVNQMNSSRELVVDEFFSRRKMRRFSLARMIHKSREPVTSSFGGLLRKDFGKAMLNIQFALKKCPVASMALVGHLALLRWPRAVAAHASYLSWNACATALAETRTAIADTLAEEGPGRTTGWADG